MKFNLIFLLILLFAYESLEKKKGKDDKKKPSSSGGKKPRPRPKTTKGTSSGTTKTPVVSTTKIPRPEDCKKMNKTFTQDMPTCYPVCPGLPKPLCSTETLGPGCICNFPYSINATGNCILRTDCPIRSYPTTTPKPPNPCKFPWLNVECRSACPQTCDEKLQADCLVFCLPSGCQCVYPYLLTHEGECVHNDQCPKKENVKLKREKPTAKPCTGNLTAVSGRDNCVKTCGSTVDYSKCMKKTIGRACICRFPYCLDKNGVCIHERDY